MLMRYPRCHRGREDCDPISCVAASPSNEELNSMTDEDFATMNYTPSSFVCCGANTAESRTLKRDNYRLCFKNEVVDDISDNDMQDLTSLQKVIADTLLLDAVQKVNFGIVEHPVNPSEKS
jgi:hypothetical protein